MPLALAQACHCNFLFVLYSIKVLKALAEVEKASGVVPQGFARFNPRKTRDDAHSVHAVFRAACDESVLFRFCPSSKPSRSAG